VVCLLILVLVLVLVSFVSRRKVEDGFLLGSLPLRPSHLDKLLGSYIIAISPNYI
jgi:hypothetical protein